MYLQEQEQTDPLMSQRGFPLFPTAMPHNLHTYNLPHAASIASLFLPRPPKKLPVLMISASFDIWKTLLLDLVNVKDHHKKAIFYWNYHEKRCTKNMIDNSSVEY